MSWGVRFDRLHKRFDVRDGDVGQDPVAEVDHVTVLAEGVDHLLDHPLDLVGRRHQAQRVEVSLKGDVVACAAARLFWTDGPIHSKRTGAPGTHGVQRMPTSFCKDDGWDVVAQLGHDLAHVLAREEFPIDRGQDPAPRIEQLHRIHPVLHFGLEVGDGGVGDFLKQRMGGFRLREANDLAMSKLRLPCPCTA